MSLGPQEQTLMEITLENFHTPDGHKPIILNHPLVELSKV